MFMAINKYVIDGQFPIALHLIQVKAERGHVQGQVSLRFLEGNKDPGFVEVEDTVD
jgi:hypothetical protein